MRKFSLSLLANAVNSGHDQGERCLSPMFLALLTCWHQCTIFRKYLPFSFLYKLTSIYRQNRSWEKILKSQNSDKATSFSSAVVNIASRVKKVSYSKPLHNKSKRLYYEALAKHPVQDSDFVLLYIHRKSDCLNHQDH